MKHSIKTGYLAIITAIMLVFPSSLVLAAAPTAPSSLVGVSNTPASITLNWSAATDDDGVAGYRVYRDAATVPIATTAANILTYTDSGLVPASTHTYSVTAFDFVNNESAHSPTVTVTTMTDTSSPSIPLNLSATAISDTKINLSWSVSTDNVAVTGYKIFRNQTQIATTSTNSYQDTGLTASTSYTYNVSAFDAAGNVSSLSASSSATTLATPVTPPASTSPVIKVIGGEDQGRLINLRSNAKIKVIVYASSNFNPDDIVLSSVTFGGAPAETAYRSDSNRDNLKDSIFEFRASKMTDLINAKATGTVQITFKAQTASGQQISSTATVRVKNLQLWKHDREDEDKLKKAAEKAKEQMKKRQERMKEQAEKSKGKDR
jgi:chitodextrinase